MYSAFLEIGLELRMCEEKKNNLIQIICKPHIHDFKNGSSPFVFAEKPSSVQIMDKPEVLKKDKLVTVRLRMNIIFMQCTDMWQCLHNLGIEGADLNNKIIGAVYLFWSYLQFSFI